jgi:hypothetical protein
MRKLDTGSLDTGSNLSTLPRTTDGLLKLVHGSSGGSPANNAKMTTVQLALPFLQALALAHFVRRVDFETVVGFASVAAASDDHESEADLVWLALIALRNALAEAVPGPGNGRDAEK